MVEKPDVQHPQSSGKLKSKLRCDFILHKSELPRSIKQMTAHTNDDLAKGQYKCENTQPLQKPTWCFLGKLRSDLPLSPVVLLWDIYLKKVSSCSKEICSIKFTDALFTIARGLKQPTCVVMVKWIMEICYTYTAKCYSAVMNNKIMKFTDKWMQLKNHLE